MNVTFSAELSERTVTLQTVEDAVLEPMAEIFFVRLMVPADQLGLALGTDTATVSITDDDSKFSKTSDQAVVDGCVCLLAIAVRLSASTFMVDESSGVVNVTFEREGEISDRVGILISTASGTAEGT